MRGQNKRSSVTVPPARARGGGGVVGVGEGEGRWRSVVSSILAWHKIVIQCPPVVYDGISHLSLV